MWGSTVLKTFNNYSMVITENNGNIRILVMLFLLLVNSTGCSGEFFSFKVSIPLS